MSVRPGAPPPYGDGKGTAYPPPPNPAQPAPGPAQYGGPPQQAWGHPGQSGYGHQDNSTVMAVQPGVVVMQQFREMPVRCRCPHCQAEVTTSTEYTVGTRAWLICLLVCVLGFWLGCCLIPFCVDGCKDVIHTCPNCGQVISHWTRM